MARRRSRRMPGGRAGWSLLGIGIIVGVVYLLWEKIATAIVESAHDTVALVSTAFSWALLAVVSTVIIAYLRGRNERTPNAGRGFYPIITCCVLVVGFAAFEFLWLAPTVEGATAARLHAFIGSSVWDALVYLGVCVVGIPTALLLAAGWSVGFKPRSILRSARRNYLNSKRAR